MTISIIAALGARNRVIGRHNNLPWSRKLKPDMDRFKELTKRHAVVMGRATWESLDSRFKPLPDRTNFVVTSNRSLSLPSGVIRAFSLFGATQRALHFAGKEEVFVIGGQGIYEEAIYIADRLYLTLVDEDAEGDRFFPDYSHFSKEVERMVVPDFEPRLTFLTLERA